MSKKLLKLKPEKKLSRKRVVLIVLGELNFLGEEEIVQQNPRR